MKCQNCGNETTSKDNFCNNCGYSLHGEDASYINEIRKTIKDQDEIKKTETFDDLNLSNPTEIIKAQLRVMVAIYRRLERLENREKGGIMVRVNDFNMPFWSLVGFEFKIFLVGLFFMAIFSCLGFLAFSTFLGSVLRSVIQLSQ